MDFNGHFVDFSSNLVWLFSDTSGRLKPKHKATFQPIIILTVHDWNVCSNTDKLDGKITEDYWKEKHNQWYEEKDALYEKLQSINKAGRTFDEGANLLENFCKVLPDEYLKAYPKKKQQILKIIGSNFTYKDKKLSVELSSVFDLLINNQYFNNGGNDGARTRDLLRDRQAL